MEAGAEVGQALLRGGTLLLGEGIGGGWHGGTVARGACLGSWCSSRGFGFRRSGFVVG